MFIQQSGETSYDRRKGGGHVTMFSNHKVAEGGCRWLDGSAAGDRCLLAISYQQSSSTLLIKTVF